ncbi:MAG: GTP-binding protein [Planctomycetes bacterium]|nr:GTP-binding protein [Planctomycetota bacterium]
MQRSRTFGIVAHIDAGKTTLTERMLFDAGAQSWLGSVDDGTAAMDWLPEERARGISITAGATRVSWGGHLLQIVDTPGHVDFIAEVERCLHVLDGVVVLIDAVRGVESQTEVVWAQADVRQLPRLVFVNKLDRPGADFAAVVAELGERLECRPLPVVVPLPDARGGFAGLGDALTGAVQWFEGRPGEEVAPRLQALLAAAHERVVEAAADRCEAVLADAIAGKRIAPERLLAVLRPAFLRGELVPVAGGSALWNRGVDWLLDAVVAWLPSPLEGLRQGLWTVERAGDPAAPFCAFVFKVQHLDEVWNYVRVVRGTVRPGQEWVRGRSPGAPRPVTTIWSVRADRADPVDAAGPGDIVVLPGELGLRTGDSICAPIEPVVAPTPRFPAPVLAETFEPELAADGARLFATLRQFAIDDPTLRVDRDQDRILVRGMGELHLDIIAERARARTGIRFQASKPSVDRREVVRSEAVGAAEVRALVAGVERSARCQVRVVPQPEAGPARVVGTADDAAAGVALAELRERVLHGRSGPLFDCEVRLESAQCPGATPVEAMLQQAAARALEQALELGGVEQCQPWVDLEITAPEEAAAAVLADLGARGAELVSVAAGRLGARLQGRAPLQRMLGYVTKLRSMTKGRGQVWLRPAGYRAAGGERDGDAW